MISCRILRRYNSSVPLCSSTTGSAAASNQRRYLSKEVSATLNDGNRMPLLGLGTWKADPVEVTHAVKLALEVGYRSIDCAAVYLNEESVGRGLKEGMESAGVKREEVFVTSKLWNTEHRPERVKDACLKTMKDLGVDYLDLYLMHWPVAFRPAEPGNTHPQNKDGTFIKEDIPLADTWIAMQNLVRQGLVRSIGVSNFSEEHFKSMLEHSAIIPAVNQIELHPYLPQKELVAFCRQIGVQVESYSPLGRGLSQSDNKPALMLDSKVFEIADKHKCAPSQVLLRWNVQHGFATIPKSVTPSRIKENFNIWNARLSPEDMKELDGLDCGCRYVQPAWFSFPTHAPK